jgi:PAS domain S-box-containing protein
MEDHKDAKSGRGILLACFTSWTGYWVVGATMLVVLLAGLWAVKQSGQATDRQMRRELMRHAVGVATAISPSSLRGLSFTEGDSSLPEFQQLCDQLRAYAETAGLHRLYTMALSDGQIVSGPESLPEDHPQASPPGTVCGSPDQNNFKIFQTGRPEIHGPARDEYGTHMTAWAPVIDPVSGDVLAVVGVDEEGGAWKVAVQRAQRLPGGIALALLLLLLLIGFFLRLHRQSVPDGAARFRHTEATLYAVFLTALSLAVAGHFNRLERASRRDAFYLQAQSHSAAYLAEMNDLDAAMDQMVCFFESSQDITYNEFRSYCRKNIQRGLVGACVWAPAVSEESSGLFVQSARGEGFPAFSIWQKNKEGVREPVSGRPVYYPARYIVPPEFDAVWGFDLNSEPLCNTALQQALRTGLSAATDPVRLFSSANSRPTVLILKPVNTPNHKGLTVFAVHPENLLGDGRLDGRRQYDLEACLSQLQVGHPPFLIARSSSLCGPECWRLRDPDMGVTVPVFRFGKVYALRMTPEATWLAAHPLNSGWIAGLIGLLLTGLISGIVALISNRRFMLEEQVEHRTKELKDSEAKLDLALRSADMGVWQMDIPTEQRIYDEQACRILGLDPAMFRGTLEEFMAVVHPDDRQRVLSLSQKGYPACCPEYRVVWADGTIHHVAVRGKSWVDDEGRLQKFAGIIWDVTKQKQAEETVRASQHLLEGILDMIPLSVFWKDQNLVFQGCNARFAHEAGFSSPAEIIGKNDYQMSWHKRADIFRSDDMEFLRKGEAELNIEETRRCPDGKFYTLLTNKIPLCDKGGKICGVLGTSMDITERKKMENDLRESQRINETIINAIPAHIFMKDKNLVFLGCNEAFARSAGFDSPQEVIGKDDYQMSWCNEADSFRANDRDVMETGQPKLLYEGTRTFPDGTHTFLGSMIPLRDESGGVASLFGMTMDITASKQAEQEVKRSLSLLEATLESTADGIMVADSDGKIVRYNRTFVEMWRLPEELVSAGMDDAAIEFILNQLCEPERFIAKVKGLYLHLDATSFDVLHLRDGRVFERYSQPQKLGGKVTGRVWSFRDITARRQAEEALRESEQSLRESQVIAGLGNYVLNISTGIWTSSPVLDDIFGIDAAYERTVAGWMNIIHPDDREMMADYFYTEVLGNRQPFEIEYRIISRSSHAERWVYGLGRLKLDDSGNPVEMYGTIQDITERKRVNDVLKANEERYQRLAQHLEIVREEERKRLARELHDDIGQILTALKIDLTAVDQNCACGDEVKEKTADMQNLLSEGIKSVHSLCRNLRPGALDDLGLEEALAGMVDEWQHRNTAKCVLFADVDDESFTDEIRTAVFRLVQEALTNVSRYAKASRVEINLVSDGETLNFSVTDNGIGMAPGAAEKPTSFGLLGMRERVEALGGELCIESKPGEGAQIMGNLPLPLKT